MERIYNIYKITNFINNKVYIGQAKDCIQRWRQHKAESKKELPRMIVNRAMKKYGFDNFSFEVIVSCKTWKDANETETLLVSQYESHISTGKGYNVSAGGCNAPKSDEWKQKVSRKLMGHPVSEETLAKLSVVHKGKHYSAKTEFKHGFIPWNKDKPWSLEQKQKVRKLTPEQEILIINDSRSSRVLAKEFGVNKSTILDIRKRNKSEKLL